MKKTKKQAAWILLGLAGMVTLLLGAVVVAAQPYTGTHVMSDGSVMSNQDMTTPIGASNSMMSGDSMQRMMNEHMSGFSQEETNLMYRNCMGSMHGAR